MVWFVLLFSFIKIKPCFLRSWSITFNFNWKKDKEHNIIFFFISFLLLFLTCFQLNYKVTREFNWNKRENEAKGLDCWFLWLFCSLLFKLNACFICSLPFNLKQKEQKEPHHESDRLGWLLLVRNERLGCCCV